MQLVFMHKFAAGEDSTSGQYNATFLVGTTKATTSIPIRVDSIVEKTEHFSLRLYINGAGYGLGLQSGKVKMATAYIIGNNIS